MIKTYSVLFVLLFSSPLLPAQDAWNLDDCIDYARKNNIQVLQLGLQVQKSGFDHRQSKFDLLPDFNFFGSHGYNWGKSIDPFTNTFATDRVRSNNFYVNGRWTLYNGMAKQNTMKATDHDMQYQQKQLEALQDNISIQLTNAYLQILYNTELLRVAEVEVDLSREQLIRVEKLVAAGSAPKGDMYDIRSQKAKEELDVVNLQNQLDISYLSMIQFLQLTGDSARFFRIRHPDVSDIPITEPNISYYDVYAKALEIRPEIEGARQRIMSVEYSADVTKSVMVPSLAISGSFGTGYSGRNSQPVGEPVELDPQLIGFTSTGEDVFVPRSAQAVETKAFRDQLQDNLNESVSINLNIPLFNRMTNRTNYQKAKLDVIFAEHDLQAAKDQLRTDVQNAYTNLIAAYKKYVASEEAVNALEESYKYAQVRFEQNAINSVDFNQTKTSYTVAKADLLRAKYEYIFNSKIVDFYQGVPLSLN